MRTIVRRGATGGTLIVYVHIEASLIEADAQRVMGNRDTLVVEYRGAGTSAYVGLWGSGGWAGWRQRLETELGFAFGRTVLITWSAGSQAAKEAASGAISPDAIVMVDGLYAPKPPGAHPGDGRVVFEPGLQDLARYGFEAAQGTKTLAILHSRIPTPYASSKECAEALQRWVEGALGTPLERTPHPAELAGHPPVETWRSGGLSILEFAGSSGEEHVLEAHLWDEACRLFVPFLATAPVQPPQLEDYGQAALAIARRELAAGIVEEPLGSNRAPQIQTYLAPCRRGEAILWPGGPPAAEWCAAFACFCADAARPLRWPGPDVPHGYRASVAELWQDAARVEAAHAPGAFTPSLGDLVLFRRAGGDPTKGGSGHVGRVASLPDRSGRFTTIEGNHLDRVALVEHQLDELAICGFIAYPRSPSGAFTDDERAILMAGLAMSLDATSRDLFDP